MISAKRNGSSPSLHANGAVGALGHDAPKEPHSLALSEENMNDSSEENLSEGSGAFLEPIAESSAPPTSRRESKSGAAGSRFPAAGESGRGNFVVPRPLPNIDPLKAERLEQRLTAFTSTAPFSSSPFTTTSITSTPTSTSAAASSTVSSLLATSVTPSPSTAAPSTAPALQSQTLVTDQPQPSLTVPTFSDFMAIEENLSKSGDEGNKDGDSTSSSRMTKRKRFTLEEDKKLVEGYNAFGNDWEKIRSWGNMERTADQLTRRFSRLKKSHPDILQQVSSSSKTSSSSVVSKLDRTSQDMLSPESSQPPRKVQRLNSTVLDDGAGPSAATPPAPSVLISSGQTCPRGSEQDVEYPSLSSGDEFIPKDKRTEETSRLEELRVQQERLLVDQERLAQLETALKEKELALLEREAQLQHQFEQAHAKSRAMIQELLIQASEREREEDRQKVMMDCLRLGQLVFERHGTEYHEIWREGKAFKDLKKKKDVLVNKRNALEEQRKQLRKTKTKSASSGASSSSSAGSSGSSTGGGSDEGVVEDAAYEEYVQIQEEIIRLQLQRFKKEEAELEEQLNKLVFEKKLHIRELKRASDEDNSRFNNHPVLNQRYLLLNLLGKGGFSEVYKAHDLQENRQVACKIHQLHSFWGEAKKQNYTKHAVREYKIHKDLNHARVVSLFDVFKIDESSFCTVLEYCDGGDLDMYLKTRNRLSEKEARIIVLQIFSGLKYLNEQKRPIIHYDLKPGNILFSDGAVKITDFGLSKIMEENTNAMELTSQGAGTYWYLPPECFEVGKQAPRISSKVDVWSAGVIFYQLLYGKKPFGNSFSQQKLLVENVITQACKVEFPSKPAVTQQCKVRLLSPL
ncbi:Serine/threonine-protein kinase tousled-like 2, partial [Balamuthia mandrillaris]